MKGEVYAHSVWTVLQAAELYYLKNKTQKEISAILGVSPATVSRLIQRAKSEGIIRFHMSDSYQSCLRAAEQIRARYCIRDAIVVNTAPDAISGRTAEDRKRAVAKEGARYVQRIIRPKDILGVAWGGTMYYLIHFLNPCQKTDTSFITLHGSLDCCDYELDVGTLTRRMAMALGGSHFEFVSSGLLESPEALRAELEQPHTEAARRIFQKTTVSVSGIGSFAPEVTSPLARLEYLSPAELQGLQAQGVCADLMLRFFNEAGEELPSSIRERTLAIDSETYRNIPCKIIVASGPEKAYALRAALRGGLADVIIVDDRLATALLDASV